jgi:hypothetical protein
VSVGGIGGFARGQIIKLKGTARQRRTQCNWAPTLSAPCFLAFFFFCSVFLQTGSILAFFLVHAQGVKNSGKNTAKLLRDYG